MGDLTWLALNGFCSAPPGGRAPKTRASAPDYSPSPARGLSQVRLPCTWLQYGLQSSLLPVVPSRETLPLEYSTFSWLNFSFFLASASEPVSWVAGPAHTVHLSDSIMLQLDNKGVVGVLLAGRVQVLELPKSWHRPGTQRVLSWQVLDEWTPGANMSEFHTPCQVQDSRVPT